MSSVLEAVKLVEDTVEKIKNDGVQEFPIAATVGDAVRQGDIYIQLIEPVTEAPVFFKKQANPVFPFQLAPGNTKGSRHCLEYSDGIEVYLPETTSVLEMESGDDVFEMTRGLRDKIFEYAVKVADAGPSKEARDINNLRYLVNDSITEALSLSGPIFVAKNATKVSHPEHGDWILPAGSYRCVFQRTVTSENTVRRVLD